MEKKEESRVKVIKKPISALDDDMLLDMFFSFKEDYDRYGPYLMSGYEMYVALGREIERRLEKRELKKALSGEQGG